MKVLDKPKGIPDITMPVALTSHDGEPRVMVSINAVSLMDSTVVAQLSLSPSFARGLGTRLLQAAKDADSQREGYPCSDCGEFFPGNNLYANEDGSETCGDCSNIRDRKTS